MPDVSRRRSLRFHTLALRLLALHVLMASAFAQQNVFRDRVEPHWNSDNTRFWYRNDLPDDTREFVMVDAVAGTRGAAFEHDAVAAALEGSLGRDVSAASLPIEQLTFADDAAAKELVLIGPDGRFTWNADTSTLTRNSEATSSEPRLFLPPRPSGESTEDTELVLTNQLDESLDLLWIDTQGESRHYEELAPNATHTQHTFVGHVWMLQKSDGTPVGCFVGESGRTSLTITDDVIDNVQRQGPRRGRRRRPDQAAQNPSSPDGKWTPIVRDHNLWLQSTSETSEHQLTSDGTAANTFRRDAQRARGISMDYDRADFPDNICDVRWSPDSRFLLAFQTTQVEERRVQYIESSPRDQLQPKLQSYPYFKAGDAIPVTRPRLFRAAKKVSGTLEASDNCGEGAMPESSRHLFHDSEIAIATDLFPNPWSLEFQQWSDDGSRCWLLYNERGHQRLRVLEVTAETGAVRAVVDELSDTFIHYSSDGKFELRWLPHDQLLWASERSGWNHLYRYDLATGEVINAVTSGDWNVRRIERIDDETGTVWFFAVGAVPGQDPYHEHFCRVNLDGTDFRILTEGDGTHEVTWSPDRRWFLDRFSRVDLPPVTELRSADGALVCSLETADASELIAEQSLPQRFVAKGRDGLTDIHGIIHRPRDFDPDKSYAVIENIYAGPHDHHVPKSFRARWGHQQQIANAGFIVVQIDGMGTAWRSKAFHDVCFKNLKDAGFPDRVAWMKAAAAVVPQMDLSRVGIYGGSAGGQNAMTALLWHGDFYKAAVADCGCHDNRMDKIWWNEQWMGQHDAADPNDAYITNSNMENAHLLQGKLMLVVGELDRNVDPATTMQVARQLVQANKDFDLLIVPGAGHGACETPWASRKRLGFFRDSLADDTE